MVAKVENYCMKNSKTKSISVDGEVKACINCIWYEQHRRPNRGNVWGYVGIHTGRCILQKKECGVLDKPCKKFETE